MSNDVLITPGSRKIEFKDSSANVDAKIETDASGNLLITNTGGDISIGDTSSDIFVGDGTNNIDIVFEQNGEIRGTSGVTVTLGASGSNVTMASDLNLNNNDITNAGTINAANLNISGTTTTISSTNTTITDSIIELNSGLTVANSKDIGFVFERGSTGNNAAFIWDESADRFTVITTTGTASDDTLSGTAANFQAGSFYGNGANLTSLSGSNISSGTVADARIPSLAASKITSGTFADARIPSLAASKITSGTFATARIPSLAGSKITSGTIDTARLPNPIQLTGANAIIKLQETGVTNNPTWWHVADGGNYSIRLNNAGNYPIQITTDSDNDAVSEINFNYTVDLNSQKLQFGGESTSYIQNVNKQDTDVWRFQTEDGRVDIGVENTSWAHFTTDRNSFYFSPKVTVQGNIEPYADSSHNLGANTLRWTNVYADTLHGDGSNITGVTATDSTKLPLTGGTITGAVNYTQSGDAITISSSAPQMKFNDTTSGSDDFWIHVNSNNFYVLVDRDDDGSWDGSHPLQLEGDTDIGYLFGQRIFNEGYHPNADKWTTAKTLTLGGDLTGNVSFDGSANFTLTAAVADDSHNHIISNVDGLQTALNAKAPTANPTFTGTITNAGTITTGSTQHLMNTPHGYISLGPQNTSWGHIYTDRPNFYFNKNLYVLGDKVFHDTYHPNADKWTTQRTLTLSGEMTGSVSFDGSGAINMTNTVLDHGAYYLGATTAETGRTVKESGLYTYNVHNNNLGTGTSTAYYSVMAWGAGTGGSAQLAAKWTSNWDKLYFRSLRDTTNNWSDWREIYHTSHKPTYTELGTMAYSNLTGTPTIPAAVTNNNQLTNGAGYITDGNTNWNNTYGFITSSDSSITNKLPLAGGTITGGLTISGSVDSGATNMGFYESAGTNLILKGDANGRSGIFFESEKNGTNINDPSDYGFIQYHPYGHGGTSGEAADFVIGVSNDSTDHVIIQSPYNGGVKVGYKDATSGTGLTTQTVFHDAYHPNADKWTSTKTLTLGGDLTGNVSFDGSANFTLTAAVADDSHNHIISNVDGLQSALDGKTSIDHFRHTGHGNYTSTTTSALLTEALGDDAFDSKLTAHKTSWSYSGNGNLTDAGRLTELAGTSWLWWTDNSADNVQGNITGLVIAPTTGGSAGKMFVYNNQGASYAPGWREIWTSTSDGAGSGLDADKLDNQEGSYYLDYNNFTNTPSSGANYYLNGISKSGNTLTFSVNGATNQSYTFGSNAFNSTTIPTNNNQLTNGAGYITGFDITTQTDAKYVRSDTGDTASGQITFSNGGVFATNGVRLYRQNTNSTIWFNGSSAADTNHALWNSYYGTSPTTRGAANSGFDGIYWNTYQGIHIRGGLGGAVDCIKVANSSGSTTDHNVTLYASNAARLATNTTGVDVTGRTTTDGLTSVGSIIVSGASPTIVSRGSDSEIVFQSTNESASNPQQFFIQHNLGNVNIGNSRGNINFSAGTLQYGGNTVLTTASTQSKYLRSDTSDQHTSGQITFNGGIHIGSTNTYIVQHVTNGLGFRVGTGNYYGLKIDPTAGHTETIKTGVGGAYNALQGVLQVKGDQTMNRGSIIRWANDGGGTGEYIHSKASSPYDVCLHSGSYDGIQVPNTGAVRINHNGAQKFVTTSTGVSITGALVASGNITAYSDRNKKKNIRDLESASKYLNSINPKRFAWKDTEKEDIGFIAQDVEEAGLSEFVSDSPAYNSETALEEGIIKTLDYGKMVSVLWGAVKEQQELINKLTSRLDDIEKGE